MESSKSNIIRPLSAIETAQFLKEYKDLFFNSIVNQQKDPNQASLYEKINNLSYVHNKIDTKCVLQINKRLVRVEYPGEVKNIDKAIATLGGMVNIETTVAEHSRKLELRFHPENRYNKPCVADKDFKQGILIKVKIPPQAGPSNSEAQETPIYDYEVVGVSIMNFIFNRLCDFQYLPLIAQEPECKTSKTESIYHHIIPKQLPDFNWLIKDESKNMVQFLPPVRFSQYDSSQRKLNVETIDKPEYKPKTPAKIPPKQQKNICKIFGKHKQQISIFVNFKDKEMPTKPLDAAVRLFQSNKILEERIERVRQLFEERPIWTKAAIRYNTGLTVDHTKLILPMVAYYFTNGPWRISWVKFGYDPRKDPKARIYQTLDYRIRTGESTILKVKAKRSYISRSSLLTGHTNVKKVSLKDNISTKPRSELDERSYVLRPSTIPPARIMFYQLCDIILPEIQLMLSKVPKTCESYCDPKDGWLPKNFIEDCRNIVNKHVLRTVQLELMKDKQNLEEKETKERVSKKETTPLEYCNQMLSNIKKGIYKNVNFRATTSRDVDMDNLEDDIAMVDLSSDEEESFTVGEIIQSVIPEKMDDDADEEELDSASVSSEEPEIDMEVVEEINQMISQSNIKM